MLSNITEIATMSTLLAVTEAWTVSGSVSNMTGEDEDATDHKLPLHYILLYTVLIVVTCVANILVMLVVTMNK